MVDEKTMDIVRSTAPVLKQHSKEIGKRFYELLFSRVPDLNNMFNQTNQRRGLQQEALAYAVYEAGAHIENLNDIKAMVERITQKHRALGVKPEHYPVVGEVLLAAVKDVLGDAATDDIIKAWGKAYQHIADVFIGIEQKLYDKTEQTPGGWIGLRKFTVDEMVKESDVISSFFLKPQDGKPIASFEAGQYLTLNVNIPEEKYTDVRHYSLSDAPGKDYYRITVKREDARKDNVPDGIVSTFLHNRVREGDVLEFAAPAGDFTIKTKDEPLILISGGVGLTPMMSMLNTTVETQPNRLVTFIHAAINGKTHAMREHVKELAASHPNVKSFVCYEAPTEEDRLAKNFDKDGFVNLDWLQSILPDNNADFYLCGPLPFMKAVLRALKEWGVPTERIHYELFSPVGILEDDDHK